MQQHQTIWPLSVMCRVLRVSRSGNSGQPPISSHGYVKEIECLRLNRRSLIGNRVGSRPPTPGPRGT